MKSSASETRRSQLVEYLNTAKTPVSASTLAAHFGISRQVIVGDIALLRASGEGISATPRGYIINKIPAGLRRTVACIHCCEDTARELNIMVDNGCTVVDVTVEHPIYGQISGQLCLSSRYDVSQFVARLSLADAPPLSSLTGGVHLHTLICPNEAAYKRVCAQLKAEGLLFAE